MNLLSFDIEISDVFDLQPGEDLEVYAPTGRIRFAAMLMIANSRATRVWRGWRRAAARHG